MFRTSSSVISSSSFYQRSFTSISSYSTSPSSSSSGAIQRGGALNGIKILDLTRILAGPFCSMLLADLGAQVIKVERPFTGDETRNWGPPFIHDQYSCYYAAINRNKKSIAINLKHSLGLDVMKDLARKCDIFIENYVPGKLSQLGLSYEHLLEINPSIIYCSITGFGSDGPYSARSGYDVIAASIGGLLSITGPEDGEPCRAGIAVTDLTTGLYAKSAILAALYQREKHGTGGCKIDCNLLSSQVSLLTNLASSYLNANQIGTRRGTAHENMVPYQSFKCSDGKWITIGAGSNQMFGKLCDAIGLTQVKHDKRFESNAKRVENRNALISLIAEKFVTKSIQEWLAILEHTGIAYGQVNDLDDVFRDQQVLHSESVLDTYHPIAGNVRTLSNAVKYRYGGDASHDGTDKDKPNEDQQHLHHSILNQGATAPPLLGEHSKEILSQFLSYDEDTIKKLFDQGVVH